MPKAKTYEEVKYFIEVESNSGCRLISTEYINNTQPLDLECKCGNPFTVNFNTLKAKNRTQCGSCRKMDKHNKIYNTERIEKIISLYNQNKTMKEISKIIKMKPENISQILKENNIKIRNNTEYLSSEQLATTKKYYFDQDFFSEIDNELKAYWLGFLFADGNVYIPKYNEGKSKGGRVDIALKAEDDYHLYNFNTDINGNIPVTYRDIKLNGNTYKSCRITANSIKMAYDLITHGCIPNKSLVLEFPKHLPQILLPHFIRGYIDGDGCVCFKLYDKSDSFSVSMLGTYNFLTYIKSILMENGIKSYNIKPEKSEAFNLGISGRDNLVKLYNYLYKDASRFLGRKIDLFRRALLYYDKDFAISPTAKLFAELDDELQEMRFDKWYKKSNMYKILQKYKSQQESII